MLYQAVKPILFSLNPELVHNFTVKFLLANFPFLLINDKANYDESLAINIAGINFPNRIGLAAGMDKNAEALHAWENMGFGFVEMGTVTYHAQDGNPLPRLFRIPECKSLLNRLGFNNDGAVEISKKLDSMEKLNIPLGINLGKSRIIDAGKPDLVIEDYLASLDLLQEYADYITINVSSPNTPNLREWEKPERLSELLKPISDKCTKPLFVKISADQDTSNLDPILEMASNLGLAGIIATNTTIDRSGAPSWTENEAGGISGELVKDKSRKIIEFLAAHRPKDLALISVGGINSADEAKYRLDLGVDLLQIYTGLIYEGPGLITKINQSLAK